MSYYPKGPDPRQIQKAQQKVQGKQLRKSVAIGAVVLGVLFGLFREPVLNTLPDTMSEPIATILGENNPNDLADRADASDEANQEQHENGQAPTETTNVEQDDATGDAHSVKHTPEQANAPPAQTIDQSEIDQDPEAKVPSESLARSVLTDNIVKQLGNDIKFNGYGAFIINGNQTNLNAKVSSKAYAQNAKVDELGRAHQGNAMLDKTIRQYENRKDTGNGGTGWTPVGWHQLSKLSVGRKRWAIDRGHLLGYALIGNFKGFDASTDNPENISVQTAWANESQGKENTGQNYYESLVRQAVDKNHRVRYRVTNLYDGDNLIPSGAHIEARSEDDSLMFNVFVPNVQPNIIVNYKTGEISER